MAQAGERDDRPRESGEGPDGALQALSIRARVLLAFAVFGLGAVILAISLIPLRLLCRREVADTRAQNTISRAFRLFLASGSAIGLWRIDPSGAEALRVPGRLVIANHPTLIDVVMLLSMAPRMDCVAKASAWRNPALALIVRVAGYVSNEDGEETVSHCVERIRRGGTVLLFPEGTRSPRDGLRRFQRGAAHVALRAGCPVVPVFIRCTPPVLGKDQSILDYPARGIDVRIDVDAPMDPSSLVPPDQPTRLQVRRLTEAWTELFARRLGAGR